MGKKSKSKKPQTPSPPQTDSNVSIERLLIVAHLSCGSEPLAAEVSRLLCIPDYTTPRGLKQCLQDFDKISSKLDQVFAQSRQKVGSPSADKLAAAVIAIYCEMNLDKLLRTRIVAETDFLNKTISLLSNTLARRVAMAALSAITHVADIGIRENILPVASSVLDAAEKHFDDIIYVEDAVCVLKHSIEFILDAHVDTELARLVPFPRVLKFFLNVARLPTSTSRTFDHILDFCSHATPYYPSVFSSFPDVVDFLVACTRAQDLWARNAALRSLKTMHPRENKPPVWVPRLTQPPDFARDLARYGSKGTGSSREVEECQKLRSVIALLIANPAHCLADFGHKLADTILTYEAGVRAYFVSDARALYIGGPERDVRLASGMLHLAADAVRVGSGTQADEKADILELEFLLISRKFVEASTLAQSCIERYPSAGFFYYVLAMLWSASTADSSAGLWGTGIITSMRAAKRGLQCSDLTVFLREELLYYAAAGSDHLVADMLSGHGSGIHIQEVLALIENALTTTRSFVDSAPPDCKRTSDMIAFNIHLAFLTKGQALDDESSELQSLRDQLSLSYDIARSSIYGLRPSQQCRTIDKIFARISTASQVWKPLLSRLPPRQYRDADPNVDLAAWLEKLEIGDPQSSFFAMRGFDISTMRYGGIELRCCSMCKGASAALKRCAGCQEARYCNSACQKRHWEVHRKTCKGRK
ncbi:hypothetical protein C8R46DRAFT_1059071 [Mycena filopes]|nr:hypothetical protein C8R46DRAFT_1059071 [Mycena filopes]